MKTIEELEKYAKENKMPIITDEGISYMENYIKENNVKNILEIGSSIGYSAIKMALVDKEIKITTIERDLDRYTQAKKNISDFNLESQVNLILGDALEEKINGCFDLIFIDAAKAQYIKFFDKFSPLLNKNGAIITDNLKFHGFVDNPELTNNRNTKQLARKIKNFIVFLEENNEFETMFLNIGDGLAISTKR